MSTKDDRIRFTFRMPDELLKHLKSKSDKLGVSVNALILQILWEWVEEKAKNRLRR